MSGYKGPPRKVVEVLWQDFPRPAGRTSRRVVGYRLQCGHQVTLERTQAKPKGFAACPGVGGKPCPDPRKGKPATARPAAAAAAPVETRVPAALSRETPPAPPAPAVPPPLPGVSTAHPSVLAAALRQLLDDPVHARELAEAAWRSTPEDIRLYVEDLQNVAAAAVDLVHLRPGVTRGDATDALERRLRVAGLLGGELRGGGIGSRSDLGGAA